MKVHRMVHLTIQDLAIMLAPKLRGWINYCGWFNLTGLKRAMRLLKLRLLKWLLNRYRRFRRKPRKLAWDWLRDVKKHYPNLFIHWQYGF